VEEALYCSGTIRCHPSFMSGSLLEKTPSLVRRRLTHSDSQGRPKRWVSRNLEQSSHHSSLSPPKLSPSQYSHSGKLPSSVLGWPGFLKVLLGTLLWIASNLPGVWLEAIGKVLRGLTTGAGFVSLLGRLINSVRGQLPLHLALFAR
jgi:hypothetical protein